jgi:demethylmacrocin O-methyltransferase
VIKTFETIFPILRDAGIYVIEDTQTSYWPSYGGSSRDINDASTIMGYFTRLVHSLNHEEMLRGGYSPTKFDRHIVAMHFYHNLILIYKGENSEGSNELRKYGNDARIWIEGPPGPLTKPAV